MPEGKIGVTGNMPSTHIFFTKLPLHIWDLSGEASIKDGRILLAFSIAFCRQCGGVLRHVAR